MPKPLPPTVGERLARCGTHVQVWGVVPGSQVTLDVGGATQVLPAGGATGVTFTVSGLSPGAPVRARQQVGSDPPSEWGNVATVEDAQVPPAAPLTELAIPACAHCMAAWGAAPGSRIEIKLGNQMAAEGEVGPDGQACMEMRIKPASSMLSATITCGTPSPATGSVGVYSATAPLPPPDIIEPVFECQTKVGFKGLVPGASVEVFVTDTNGSTSSLGTFCACTSKVNADVGHVMKRGDRLRAVQSIINTRWQCQVPGEKSKEVAVVPPDARIKPKIEEMVFAGDPILRVTNQIDGAAITILSRNFASGPEEDLGSRPSDSQHHQVPVPSPLRAGQVLRIKQVLCGAAQFSDPVTVQSVPAVLPPPRIRRPIFGCAGVVIVENVLPGAKVYVRQTLPGLLPPLSPEFPIGQEWVSGSSVVIQVSPTLATDAFVTAYQEVGGKIRGQAPWVHVDPTTALPAPKIVPPAAIGTQTVVVSGIVPGARVRLFDHGVPIGSQSLPGEEGEVTLWWKIPKGAILTATQTLCNRPSPPSAPRPAVSGTGTACEGPHPFEAAKWNDGGTAQKCNNCYNYACDIRTDNFAQPGGSSMSKSQMNCADVTAKALSDGLFPCPSSQCHPCHHRVALVIQPGQDYHWYRQGPDGMWSHKRGGTAAKNVDESGNPITDPLLADRGSYTQFCGYFCVYKPNTKIGGPGKGGCP
jgi:hypothetical protein